MNRSTIAAENPEAYPLMPTYGQPPVQFVRGSGTELYDRDGKRYLDFLSGLAVTSIGHSHPAVAEALTEQARTLLHVSNLYETVPGLEVAATIDRLQGGGGQGGWRQLRHRGQGLRNSTCSWASRQNSAMWTPQFLHSLANSFVAL